MNTPLLEVSDLTKHFPTKSAMGRTTGAVKAVDGVSFTLERGTTLGLVGESGCGKSTTGKVLMRLLDPTSGSIKLDGEEVTGLRGKQLDGFRRRVQMVFQNPASSLNPRQSIGATIAAPLVEQRIKPPGGVKATVMDLMERVGLRPEHVNRFPHEFSGGQRQRIGIARALALEPDVVICDEPVSALDVSVQAQVVNLLKDIQRDTGVAYIFIAHDLAVVKHMADEVAVMYLGKMMEKAPKHADVRRPAPPLHPRAALRGAQRRPGRRADRTHPAGRGPALAEQPALGLRVPHALPGLPAAGRGGPGPLRRRGARRRTGLPLPGGTDGHGRRRPDIARPGYGTTPMNHLEGTPTC